MNRSKRFHNAFAIGTAVCYFAPIAVLTSCILCLARCSGPPVARVEDEHESPRRDCTVCIVANSRDWPTVRAPCWVGFTLRDAILLAPGDHDYWLPLVERVIVNYADRTGIEVEEAVFRDPEVQRRMVIGRARMVYFRLRPESRKEKVVYLGNPDVPIPLTEFIEDMTVRDLPRPFRESLSEPGGTALLLRAPEDGGCHPTIVAVTSTPIPQEMLELPLKPFDAIARISDSVGGPLLFGETRWPMIARQGGLQPVRLTPGGPELEVKMFWSTGYLVGNRDGTWQVLAPAPQCTLPASEERCVPRAGDVVFMAPYGNDCPLLREWMRASPEGLRRHLMDSANDIEEKKIGESSCP